MNNAYLYIEDKKYPLKQFNFDFNQPKGFNNKPLGSVNGGEFIIVFEATKDNFIREWTLSPLMQKDGYIEIADFSIGSITFKWEFANAFATEQTFVYDSNSAMLTQLNISAGIVRINRSEIYERSWNPSNPYEEQGNVTTIDNGPNILGYHIEDLEGNTIEKSEIDIDEEIVIVVESENAVGEIFEIDLDSTRLDFEHNGRVLEGDILEFKVTTDLEQIHLKAIAQQ